MSADAYLQWILQLIKLVGSLLPYAQICLSVSTLVLINCYAQLLKCQSGAPFKNYLMPCHAIHAC